MADGVAMLVVILLSVLEFYQMPLGMTVLDVIADIKIGVDMVTSVTA